MITEAYLYTYIFHAKDSNKTSLCFYDFLHLIIQYHDDVFILKSINNNIRIICVNSVKQVFPCKCRIKKTGKMKLEFDGLPLWNQFFHASVGVRQLGKRKLNLRIRFRQFTSDSIVRLKNHSKSDTVLYYLISLFDKFDLFVYLLSLIIFCWMTERLPHALESR